jgi:hypothetical protein
MHPDRATFLGVEACDLTTTLPMADVILFGASDATPYVVGQTSHAARRQTSFVALCVIMRAISPVGILIKKRSCSLQPN